jgi:two-component system, cell cycle response regulator
MMRVLIADDDDVLRHILEASLTKWGYDVIVARNGIEAWSLLQGNDAPRLAILDWIMPGMDGVEVCREIRRREDRTYTYVLLLTAKHRKEDVIAGMEAGADDYISKPFDPQELKVRLRAGRRILDLQAELLSARDTLHQQATHDGLSGLLNRSAALDVLRHELERADRQSVPLCVMLADFDHFKDINDTYGHTIGDAVLCEAARRMRASVRSYDTIGRYGGEEFLFILPGCDAESARGQAERLKASITADNIELPHMTISFTISIGVVIRQNATIGDLDSIVQAADAALYEAKMRGRNRVVLAGEAIPAPKSVPSLALMEPRG